MSQRIAVGMAILSSFLLGTVFFAFDVKILIATIIILGIFAVIVIWPEMATLVIIFVLYCNLAVVAHRIHGVPELAASMVSVLLMIPLGIYLIRGDGLVIDYPFFLMVIYFMILLVSAIFSGNLNSCFEAITLFFVEGLALYFTIINVVRNLTVLRRVVWTVLLAGLLMGGLSVFQEVTKTYNKNYWGLAQTKGAGMSTGEETVGGKKVTRHRLAGPIGSKNRYAQIMVVLIPLALYRFWGERSFKLRMLAAVAGMCIVSGTLLSFSRGAGVTIILVIGLMTLLRKIRLRYALASFLAIIIVTWVAVPQYFGRLTTLERLRGFTSQDSGIKPSSSMMGRATENLAALFIFLDHPVLGVGPGQSRLFTTEYGNKLNLKKLEGTRMAHTLYLQMLAELGIIGFVAFMAIVLLILYQLWQLQGRLLHTRPDLSNWATGFFFCISTYLISAIFLHLSYQRYYWFLVAIGGAAVQVIKAESSKENGRKEETVQIAAP